MLILNQNMYLGGAGSCLHFARANIAESSNAAIFAIAFVIAIAASYLSPVAVISLYSPLIE